MKCPICKDVTLVMSQRSNVEIDYCPECRGVWLDRGELDKILDKAVNAGNAIRHDSHIHKENYENKHYHKRYKKESFIGEIFDIFGD